MFALKQAPYEKFTCSLCSTERSILVAYKEGTEEEIFICEKCLHEMSFVIQYDGR